MCVTDGGDAVELLPLPEGERVGERGVDEFGLAQDESGLRRMA